MVKEQCGGCRFWEDVGEIDEGLEQATGYCKRYPPVRLANHDQSLNQSEWENWGHPITFEENWCGEFQPAKQELPPTATKTPIRDAGLMPRTATALLSSEITTLEEAVAKSDIELLKLPTFGKKMLKEIRNLVHHNQPAIKSTT